LRVKYLNADGSKNYEKIYSELNPLGWACYFMDDGSFFNGQVMSINNKLCDNFINRYIFGEKTDIGQLAVKSIDPQYVIPGFSYKCPDQNVGDFWKSYFPELFNPSIKKDLDLSFVKEMTINDNSLLLDEVINFHWKRGFP